MCRGIEDINTHFDNYNCLRLDHEPMARDMFAGRSAHFKRGEDDSGCAGDEIIIFIDPMDGTCEFNLSRAAFKTCSFLLALH